jgi:hypothetical protein
MEGFAGFSGGLFVGDVAIAGSARCTHVTERLPNERQIGARGDHVIGEAVLREMRITL